MFSCPIRVHSWFKHCLDYVFAYSCPFVSIRGSPSSPSFVFFRVFRAFRGSNTAWTTFLHIRVHSCPFVVLPLPPPSCFSCFSCFSWFKHCLDYVFCIFVSIRVHSWFSPFPLLRVFRAFRAFRGSNTAWTTLFCIFVSIRVHSCPFVVLPLHPSSCFSCFSWFKHCLDHVFLHIRVHSCPFVVLHLPPPSCFSWFKHCLDYVFLHIRVHS